MFDQARHRVSIQGSYFLPLCNSRQQPGVLFVVLWVAVHGFIKVGRYFEQIRELRVIYRQQVIQQASADQHDFDIERDRFWFQ